MRDLDDHDPKARHPLVAPKKHGHPSEAAEHQPWRQHRADDAARHPQA